MHNKQGIYFLMATIVLNLWNSPFTAHAAELLDTAEVDEFVADYLERNGLPGASIVIVKDGKTLYEKGYSHDSNGNLITEKSLLRIG